MRFPVASLSLSLFLSLALPEISEGMMVRNHIPVISQNTSENPETCNYVLLPKFMLMGTPHAGSTLFAELLNMHPDLSYGFKKEHHFFSRNEHGIIHNASIPPGRHELFSLAEYENQFEVPCSIKSTFDADPDVVFMGNNKLPHGAFRSQPGKAAVEELRSILGSDVMFFLIIRNPALSINSISQALGGCCEEDPDDRVMHDMMCLADSLETWLSVFPRSQFHFIDADTMFENITMALDSALEFAKLSPRQYSIDFASIDSGRRRASPLSLSWRKAYHSNPRNVQCKQRLESLTGLTFRWS